jgi:hypothetical protein
VAVIKLQPGYIEIMLLMLDGVFSDAVDAAILEHLDPEILIPMGDYVSIVKATGNGKDLTVTICFIGQAPDQGLVKTVIRTTVIRTAFAPFNARLGAQISPRLLEAACIIFSGVVYVEISGLAYEDLPATHFAFINSLFTEEKLQDLGIPQPLIDEAIAKSEAIKGREEVWSVMAQKVGDTASLVGTVSDATGLLIAICGSPVIQHQLCGLQESKAGHHEFACR